MLSRQLAPSDVAVNLLQAFPIKMVVSCPNRFIPYDTFVANDRRIFRRIPMPIGPSTRLSLRTALLRIEKIDVVGIEK